MQYYVDGTHHTSIGFVIRDESRTEIATFKDSAIACKFVGAMNACAGIDDPETAIQDARKALQRVEKLLRVITVREVIEAGDDAINAAGLNPYCLNEGFAGGSEPINTSFVRCALAALGEPE